MNLNNIKNNKKFNRYSGGFTIVEALVAILILTVSVSSMLGVTASATISARYARNEITANYLLQEAADSIRNSRDTIAFQRKDDIGGGWSGFLNRYNRCFSASGCYLKMENFNPSDTSGGDVVSCSSSGCPVLNYNSAGGSSLFYNYAGGQNSIFTRKIVMENVSADEVKATVSMSWQNEVGASVKTASLQINLLNWLK